MLSVTITDIDFQTNDFQPITISTFQNNKQTSSKILKSIPSIIYQTTLQKNITLLFRQGENLIGSITIPYEIILNQQYQGVTRWITLFDPHDDLYDGDLSEDDIETPRISLNFRLNQPLQFSDFKAQIDKVKEQLQSEKQTSNQLREQIKYLQNQLSESEYQRELIDKLNRQLNDQSDSNKIILLKQENSILNAKFDIFEEKLKEQNQIILNKTLEIYEQSKEISILKQKLEVQELLLQKIDQLQIQNNEFLEQIEIMKEKIFIKGREILTISEDQEISNLIITMINQTIKVDDDNEIYEDQMKCSQQETTDLKDYQVLQPTNRIINQQLNSHQDIQQQNGDERQEEFLENQFLPLNNKSIQILSDVQSFGLESRDVFDNKEIKSNSSPDSIQSQKLKFNSSQSSQNDYQSGKMIQIQSIPSRYQRN